jgi:hypothetical protein
LHPPIGDVYRRQLSGFVANIKYTFYASWTFSHYNHSRKYVRDVYKVVNVIHILAVFKTGTRLIVNIKSTAIRMHGHPEEYKTSADLLADFCGDKNIHGILKELGTVLFPIFQKMRDAGYRLQFTISGDTKLPMDIELAPVTWFPKIRAH